MHTMTSHIHVHVYTVSDTHIHTHTQSHTLRYHSGGDKTHAVRGCNAISARCAGKSLKETFMVSSGPITAVMDAACTVSTVT